MKKQFFRLLALSCIFLFVLSSCNLPISNSLTSEGESETAVIDLTPDGANFSSDDISLTFGSSAINSSTAVTYSKTPTEPTEDEAILAQSDIFSISGLPVEYDGQISVTLDIPRTVLNALEKSDPERDKKIVLMAGIDGYSQTAAGEVNLFFPLADAQIDLEANTISATIELANESQANLGRKLASIAPGQSILPNTYWDVTPNGVRFKVVASAFSWNSTTYSTNSGTYSIYFSSGDFGYALDKLTYIISETESAVSELGFTPKPIDIYVGDPGDGRVGLYNWNGWSGHSITIHPSTINNSSQNEPLLTFGHEYMHYMQMLSYDEEADIETYMNLDEAVAVWFESYLIYNPDYQSALANQHLATSLSEPWFSGERLQMQRTGYGASWFVHYLVNQYGFDFIKKFYKGDEFIGQLAWEAGIKEASKLEVTKVFPQYIENLYLHPDQISGGLTSSGSYYDKLFEQWVKLEKVPVDSIVFTPYKDGIPVDEKTSFNAQPGVVTGGFPPEPYTIDPVPSMSIYRTLSPWNGYGFSIKMDPSLYPQDVGQLEVTYYSDDTSSGMMIFGVPLSGNISNAIPIRGHDNPFLGEANPVVINSVSTKDNTGKYKEVLFILYNSGNSDVSMSVDIKYSPIKETSLRGEMVVTDRLYQDNPCSAMESCYPYKNPPACVGEFSGGGMGEGDTVVQVFPCVKEAPEFCYWCSEHVGASTLMYSFIDYNPSISFVIDPNGEILPFESPFGYQPVTPDITYYPDGSFSMTWTENDNYQKPYVTISMTGKVDSSGGSGTWTYDYEGVGILFSGTWSVAPSSY